MCIEELPYELSSRCDFRDKIPVLKKIPFKKYREYFEDEIPINILTSNQHIVLNCLLRQLGIKNITYEEGFNNLVNGGARRRDERGRFSSAKEDALYITGDQLEGRREEMQQQWETHSYRNILEILNREEPFDVFSGLREIELKEKDKFTDKFGRLVTQRFDIDIPTERYVEEILAYSVILSLRDELDVYWSPRDTALQSIEITDSPVYALVETFGN
jgi:hypothetical protein